LENRVEIAFINMFLVCVLFNAKRGFELYVQRSYTNHMRNYQLFYNVLTVRNLKRCLDEQNRKAEALENHKKMEEI
jgi:hypothetical protein